MLGKNRVIFPGEKVHVVPGRSAVSPAVFLLCPFLQLAYCLWTLRVDLVSGAVQEMDETCLC